MRWLPYSVCDGPVIFFDLPVLISCPPCHRNSPDADPFPSIAGSLLTHLTRHLQRDTPTASNSANAAILDPLLTPVWFRRLPPNPLTPPASQGNAMVMSLQPHAIPTTELPSPSASEVSLTSRREAEETNSGTNPPNPSRRTRSKTRRSPSRLPLRTWFRSFSGVATVCVGEAGNKQRPETKYLVHKELLTSASPFFAAALNGTFAEGLDQEVRLPEEKPEIFEWFLQWLYTGTLKTPVQRMHYLTSGMTHLPGMGLPAGMQNHNHSHAHHELVETDVRTDGELRNSQGSPKYFLLLDLYALSDRLLTTQLSNHVLSTIARLSETTNSVPTPSDTWILYDHIRDGVPLRTLILDLFAYKKTDRLLETHRDEWHPRFLRELCVKLKRPGPESISRHEPHLQAWRPKDYASSKACEICRQLLEPGISGERCVVCEKAFCQMCMRGRACGGDGRAGVYPTDTAGCKPWTGRNMCLRYHEHDGDDVCG